MDRVLIVDDSKLARDRVQNILSELDYTVFYHATNGQEAIDIYMQHKPELITLDIEMPILDGIEVARELAQISDTLKILWISSVENKQKVHEAQKLCKSAIIRKPISKVMFANALKLLNR